MVDLLRGYFTISETVLKYKSYHIKQTLQPQKRGGLEIKLSHPMQKKNNLKYRNSDENLKNNAPIN